MRSIRRRERRAFETRTAAKTPLSDRYPGSATSGPARAALDLEPRWARVGVAAAFVLNGVLLGAWASRIPAVMERHALGEASLGVLLLLMGIGALLSFPIAGRLSDRLGAVRVTRGIAFAYLAALALVGFAATTVLLGAALFLFGMAHGAMDVTMNSWATEVEKALGRSVMSSFHAMWSVGAGIGAGSGFAAASLGMALGEHFVLVAILASLGLVPLLFVRWASMRRSGGSVSPILAVPRGALALVGLIALAAGLGEGAMVDWSAVYLRDVIGADEATSTLGFGIFSATMVVMRLCADPVVTRFGPGRVARAGGLTAAIGLALVTVPATLPAALLGCVLMGMGYATLAPLAFSRAAADPSLPPGQAIASVATFGYGAMLLGPPAIGWIADASSLRTAFALLGGLALVIAILASALEHPRKAS